MSYQQGDTFSNEFTGHAPHVSVGNAKIHITFFRDHTARRLTTETLTLTQLAERVLNASAREKKKLPWLKLAIFGTKRTDKNSLRHDANVEKIAGIELDYDDEKITFDDAVQALRAVCIHALVYTSPSHGPAAPRWRILAPASKALPPEMHTKLVARLNGFLKAKFGVETKIAATESFTLSQAYYFGYVTNKPELDHRAEVIDGDFIDHRDDLAAFEATGGPAEKEATAAQGTKTEGDQVHGFDAILSKMGDGDGLEGFNGPLLRAAASYVATYFESLDEKQLKKLLREAIDKAPNSNTPDRAESIKRYRSDKYLNDIISSAIKKFTETLPLTKEHFVADMETHKYIYLPTRKPWPAASVNARIRPVALLDPDGRPILDSNKKPKRIAANEWLDRHRPVEAVTWAPGEEMIIRDRLFTSGGWFDHAGASVLNLYRPPTIVPGDANDVALWRDHLRRIYPDDADYIEKWMAHRVQCPEEKVNHALFLGGDQGIGKDSVIEPLKRAVGPWNFEEITPQKIASSQFTGYLKCVVLRISEGHDLGEINRFAFYDMTKTIIAAPPDTHRINEKHRPEYYIPNLNGVIITSNYSTNGIYLPVDDRRHYVAWSDSKKEEFETAYWDKLWRWFDNGGDRNVAAYLATLNLSEFNAKAPPPKTEMFWNIANSNAAPEEVELNEVLERLSSPSAVTIKQIANEAGGVTHLQDFGDWIKDPKSRRVIPHRMGDVGYMPVRNRNDKQGLWTIMGAKQAIYAKKELSLNEQIKAVNKMMAKIEAEAKAGQNQQKGGDLNFAREQKKPPWWNS